MPIATYRPLLSTNSVTDTLAQFSTWLFRVAGAVTLACRLVGACRLLHCKVFESKGYIVCAAAIAIYIF